MSARPLLVSIVALLTMLCGVLVLAIGVFTICIGSTGWEGFVSNVGDWFPILEDISYGLAVGTGIAMTIFGILLLLVGYALWIGWSVAWYITVILYIISVVFALIVLVTGGYVAAVPLIISVIILFYMFTPKVKTFFLG
jgi:Osmosensitive K+ channel histidine kinase